MKGLFELIGALAVMVATMLLGASVYLIMVVLSVLPYIALVAGIFYAWKWVFA